MVMEASVVFLIRGVPVERRLATEPMLLVVTEETLGVRAETAEMRSAEGGFRPLDWEAR